MFLRLTATERYLDLSITEGEQTRVDRHRLVTADVPVSTEGVLYVVDEVL